MAFSIKVKHKGDFKNLERFLAKSRNLPVSTILNSIGQKGVQALMSATPVGTGLTASSWSFEVKQTRSWSSISWLNSNTVDGLPVVILLQYGHGTGTGGYVKGQDFINPALEPLFKDLANDLWKAVTSA